MPVSGNRFYFFFDVPLPAGLEQDRTTARDDLRRYFSGWAAPVQKLIAAIDVDTTNRVEIHDIEPFQRFVKGRVVLLGDAAHSTTPDIGQGGCAAMEDAIVCIVGMLWACWMGAWLGRGRDGGSTLKVLCERLSHDFMDVD